jgi:succinyl-CoA synthetase beta subunit
VKLLADNGTPVTKPLVVRLDGNRADEGRAILRDAALDVVRPVDTMDGAARLAAELAAKG